MKSYFIGIIKNFEIIFNKLASNFIHENCIYFNFDNCKKKLIIDSNYNFQSLNKIQFDYKNIFKSCLMIENLNLTFKINNLNYFMNNLKNNTTILISSENGNNFQLTLINNIETIQGNYLNEKNNYIYTNFEELNLIPILIIISILTFMFSLIIFKISINTIEK